MHIRPTCVTGEFTSENIIIAYTTPPIIVMVSIPLKNSKCSKFQSVVIIATIIAQKIYDTIVRFEEQACDLACL